MAITRKGKTYKKDSRYSYRYPKDGDITTDGTAPHMTDFIIVRRKDCTIETRGGREYLRTDDVPQAFPLAHTRTNAGYTIPRKTTSQSSQLIWDGRDVIDGEFGGDAMRDHYIWATEYYTYRRFWFENGNVYSRIERLSLREGREMIARMNVPAALLPKSDGALSRECRMHDEPVTIEPPPDTDALLDELERTALLCELRDVADQGRCNMFDKRCVHSVSVMYDRRALRTFLDTATDSDYMQALDEMGERRDDLPDTTAAHRTLRDAWNAHGRGGYSWVP